LPGVIRRIVKWIQWWERRQSQGENGRPHAPDRSRHIALKKPCHLPVKVTCRVFELSDLRALETIVIGRPPATITAWNRTWLI
jgi:hypothetical protein